MSDTHDQRAAPLTNLAQLGIGLGTAAVVGWSVAGRAMAVTTTPATEFGPPGIQLPWEFLAPAFLVVGSVWLVLRATEDV